MVFLSRHRYSVCSGALACLASVFGKVALDASSPLQTYLGTRCQRPEQVCRMAGLTVQGAALVLMMTVNALMLSTFITALQRSGATAATVINACTNFMLAGLSGGILFGERLSWTWWVGALLVMTGVGLVTYGTMPKEEKEEKEE